MLRTRGRLRHPYRDVAGALAEQVQHVTCSSTAHRIADGGLLLSELVQRLRPSYALLWRQAHMQAAEKPLVQRHQLAAVAAHLKCFAAAEVGHA